jgi:hypothetical protein
LVPTRPRQSCLCIETRGGRTSCLKSIGGPPCTLLHTGCFTWLCVTLTPAAAQPYMRIISCLISIEWPHVRCYTLAGSRGYVSLTSTTITMHARINTYSKHPQPQCSTRITVRTPTQPLHVCTTATANTQSWSSMHTSPISTPTRCVFITTCTIHL